MARKRTGDTRSFEISNADKILFPDDGISKGDLIEYYRRVAEVMLPHVRGRVVTMERFPDGIDGDGFYQKDVPDYFPDWIETVAVAKQGGTLRQLTIENRETLAYLANQGCIAIHVWPSRADDLLHPDRLIFDLDPSTDDFAPVRKAARAVRQALDEVGLPSFVMTTGSRGLHVVSPLDRQADFAAVRDFAVSLARLVAGRDEASFTVEQRKNKRGDRVFIDYLRNAYGQHGIAPYSVRPKPRAPVATPLDWHELGDAKLHPRKYRLGNLFRRLSRKDDPWRDIARRASSLKQARARLDELIERQVAAR
jgi:bifunctional non-homologous end joining protein LigD